MPCPYMRPSVVFFSPPYREGAGVGLFFLFYFNSKRTFPRMSVDELPM